MSENAITESKQDLASFGIEAILSDPKTQKILSVAKPFIKPAFKQFIKELGNDDVRFMIYRDKETGLVCFLRIPVKNITQEIEFTAPDKDDVFIISQEDIDNPEEIIKRILGKIAVKVL